MFFDLISRNSKRNRKENGLFFASLLVSIIAFYIILSLSQQDVMLFLQEMESDAVDRLLQLIPLFYGLTLLILFFLVYFASRYQLGRRKHEFGVYLMMGMKRPRLFLQLLAEDFKSSLIALAIGLPSAILLSELISLVTARLVGIGIIGHQLTFSLPAVIGTAAGFLLIKLFAFILLSGQIAHQEIQSLLAPAPEGAKRQRPGFLYAAALLLGLLLLAAAYGSAISGYSWQSLVSMALTLLSGLAGTFLLFYGLRAVLGFLAGHSRKSQPLSTFTFRQLQENVIHQSSSLAVSCLLILAALCCFGCGVAISLNYSGSEEHVLDYTFEDFQDPVSVEDQLSAHQLRNLFQELFEMKVGRIDNGGDYHGAYSMDAVMELLRQRPAFSDQDQLLNTLSYADYPYLISVTDYNQLLCLAGRSPIELQDGEAAVYMDPEYIKPAGAENLNEVLEQKPQVLVAGQPYSLTGSVQTLNLVVDRSITLSFALIVTDDDFETLTAGNYSIYWNATLNTQLLQDQSLMQAIASVNQQLDKTGIQYESYLQNIGRQLFYVVAASYITIYLAIIFLIVANTVIGVQFLTQQQKTGRRYRTLIRLGASYETLCRSAQKQISWYFAIPTLIAAFSSFFGVQALFTGLLSSRTPGDTGSLLLISMAMILLLCVVECIYMAVVRRSSSRYILSLMAPEREE